MHATVAWPTATTTIFLSPKGSTQEWQKQRTTTTVLFLRYTTILQRRQQRLASQQHGFYEFVIIALTLSVTLTTEINRLVTLTAG